MNKPSIEELKSAVVKLVRDMASDVALEEALEELAQGAFEYGYDEAIKDAGKPRAV